MAKIYETKEDFAKDALKDQAKDLRLKASRQAGTGSSLIIADFFVQMLRASGTIKSGLVGIAGSVMGIGGVVQIIRSWFTDSKAHDLEMKRERLGPETIVLPPDMPLNDTPEKDCGCKFKKFSNIINPTSLTEQAVNSANDTRSKA